MPASDLVSDPLLEKAPTHEGYKVLGGVVLYQKLGAGGMGAVYRGKHLRLNIDVAVKVMDPPAGVQASRSGEFVRRFIREAQTAAGVSHQNLIRVYDVNAESGVHFLIMDFVDGGSATDRLKRKGRLSEAEAVEIALGAAEGLAEAHRRGVVHRDVKPDNIMIDKEGRVRVTDLGLAKAASGDSDSGPSLLTQTQAAMGTPYYMPPEQFVSARDVGPQADCWALGVTLYQLLIGSLPWTESSVFTLAAKIQSEPFPDPKGLCSGLSDGACAIIDRALRKQAAERYADCGEMAKALRAHLDSIKPSTKSVLPDAASGSTKLALVSITPPPSKTLTLIAMAALSGGPPPLAASTSSLGAAAEPKWGGVQRVVVGLLLLLLAGGAAATWYYGVHLPEHEYRRMREEEEAEGRVLYERWKAEQEVKREAEARVASILQTARSFRDAGLLGKVRDKASEALEVVPDHAEARRLLADVEAEIASKRSAAERAEAARWRSRAEDADRREAASTQAELKRRELEAERAKRKLEAKRVAELEALILPTREKLEADTHRTRLRRRFEERVQRDGDTYSTEQLEEISRLYQIANKRWNTPEARESLTKLVSKYHKANRSGCALLYLGQMSKGREKERHLRRAIQKHGDCMYGDGVQVGAYARFHLATYYRQVGKGREAQRLFKKIRSDFPDAIDHKGRLLADMMPE